MKILIDMNLSPRWVLFLESHGHVAMHWAETGLPSAADVSIMAYAEVNDYIVLTNDLDFGAIHAAVASNKPSVIQLRANILTPEAVGPQVISAISATAHELNVGYLITIDASKWRIRTLPL